MSEPRRSTAAVAALLPLVAGCVNWSGDVARYRAVLDADQASVRPDFALGAPLSLPDALRVANADNETIALAGEDYVQALAAKMRQAGTFLPTLTLVPTYTVTRTASVGGAGGFVITPGVGTDPVTGDPTTDNTGGVVQIVGGGSEGGTSDRFSAPLNAAYNGSLSDVSDYRAAARTVEQRAQLLLDQREQILLAVAQAYYDVLRFERQAGVLRNSVALREEQVRDQEARERLGAGRPLDVAQSRADLAGTRAQLLAAEASGDNARSALARLMGVAAVAGELTDDYAVPDDVPPLDDWLALAATGRHDLAAAARNVESARLAVESAIRRYYPSVGLNFAYFLYNDPDTGQRWTGGVTANLPIFSALQIESDIRRAWSVYRQAGLAYSRTLRQVVDDVAQNRRNLAAGRERVAQLALQVDAARQAVELATRAYDLGGGTNLDRLQQQDNLLTAELNLLDERYATKTDHLALLRAAGRLATALADPPAPPGPASVTIPAP